MVALIVLVHLIALSFVVLSRGSPLKVVSGSHLAYSNHRSPRASGDVSRTNSSGPSSMSPVSSSSATATIPQILTSTSSPATSKYVIAHFMVGNVYSFTVDNWLADISLAHSSGIDGFALNVGTDDWQPQQVANAYVPIYSGADL